MFFEYALRREVSCESETENGRFRVRFSIQAGVTVDDVTTQFDMSVAILVVGSRVLLIG